MRRPIVYNELLFSMSSPPLRSSPRQPTSPNDRGSCNVQLGEGKKIWSTLAEVRSSAAGVVGRRATRQRRKLVPHPSPCSRATLPAHPTSVTHPLGRQMSRVSAGRTSVQHGLDCRGGDCGNGVLGPLHAIHLHARSCGCFISMTRRLSERSATATPSHRPPARAPPPLLRDLHGTPTSPNVPLANRDVVPRIRTAEEGLFARHPRVDELHQALAFDLDRHLCARRAVRGERYF